MCSLVLFEAAHFYVNMPSLDGYLEAHLICLWEQAVQPSGVDEEDVPVI